MITAPDNVAKLLLAGGSVEKSKLLRPNLIKNDATRGGFDRFGLSISIDRLLTDIRVLNPDTVMCANASFCHCEFYLGRIAEEREPLAIFAAARVLGEVVTTEGDILGRRRDGFATGWGKNVIRREH